MANLSRSKTLFGFTSPRTIEKIVPEIRLLTDHYSGEAWNAETQARFFDTLFHSEFYEGEAWPEDPAFAARDRITRAPKALGFVNLDGPISLTPAGGRLLSPYDLPEIFTRQLLKFQLPSPYHTDSRSRFLIKPYLELLRLCSDLDGLTKDEIAIFFVSLTHIEKYEQTKNSIIEFRHRLCSITTNRKEFIQGFHETVVHDIYSDEIAGARLHVRESGPSSTAQFVATKRRNMLDYADAFIRYLRATELVTYDPRRMRLLPSGERTEEIDFILRTTEREPHLFDRKSDFQQYLYSDLTPALLSDDANALQRKAKALFQRLGNLAPPPPPHNLLDLKSLVRDLEHQIILKKIQVEQSDLKDRGKVEEIIEIFEKIRARTLPDPSLFLEWNIWRAMTMLNYARSVEGNFRIDPDGAPLSHAPAKKPDIVCEYDDFTLIVEVTMSSGQKQYEMEGEPVARHLGQLRTSTSKPVYCLFVAPNLSSGTVAHYFNLNRMHTAYYGGRTTIVPLSLEDFIAFYNHGIEKNFANPGHLRSFLDGSLTFNGDAHDEDEWRNFTSVSSRSWLEASGAAP